MVEDDGSRSDDPQYSEASDAVFEAVADEHRRLALYYLRDRGSAGIDELAAVVSGWLAARTPGAEVVTPDDRDDVRVALHHVHLPKLADAGLIRYDHDANEATLGAAPDLLDAVLDRSLADERRGSGRDDERGGSDGRDGDVSRHGDESRGEDDERDGNDSRGGNERGNDA